MAELAKMLHFLKSGTEQTAKAYSTTTEAGDNYVQGKIDSVACYIPIGATDDAMATNGRVIKGGTEYAIKSQAKPPYTEMSWTEAGTYTFTVPAGVTRMQVAVCGGGGGMAMAIITHESYSGSATGGDGGTSSFDDLITATGGGGGYYYVSTHPDRTTGKGASSGHGSCDCTYSVGAAGSPNGSTGTVSGGGMSSLNCTGGSGFALSFTKTVTSGGYGNGGYGSYTHTGDQYTGAVGGSSGGYNTGYVDVTPGETYTVTVGAAGANHINRVYCSPSYSATESKAGFVFIAYGGDI